MGAATATSVDLDHPVMRATETGAAERHKEMVRMLQEADQADSVRPTQTGVEERKDAMMRMLKEADDATAEARSAEMQDKLDKPTSPEDMTDEQLMQQAMAALAAEQKDPE